MCFGLRFSGIAADVKTIVEAVRQDGRVWNTFLRSCSGSEDRRKGCQARWSCVGLRFSEIAADREIVVKARRQDDRASDYASPKFAADREIGVEAVMQDGRALNYAAQELQRIGSAKKTTRVAHISSGHGTCVMSAVFFFLFFSRWSYGADCSRRRHREDLECL